jgi:hypothetical protein
MGMAASTCQEAISSLKSADQYNHSELILAFISFQFIKLRFIQVISG